METVGKEIKLSGNHMGFVTMFDIARDPRWGRTEEFFSEDPYLTSKFSESGVKGIKKIFIEPKTEKTVKFTLGYEELKVWSVNEKYELENGTVKIFAGSNPVLPLTAEIKITVNS